MASRGPHFLPSSSEISQPEITPALIFRRAGDRERARDRGNAHLRHVARQRVEVVGITRRAIRWSDPVLSGILAVMFRSTAHLYDLIYEASGKDYAAEAAELKGLVNARSPAARSLLDVACGTGAHLAHLLDTYEVAGVDLDPGMLAQAHQRLPQEVQLIEADMRSFSLGRGFDVVTCLFSSIGYMASTDDLRAAIRNMADHLHPAGVLILDGWVRPHAWRPSGSVHIDVTERDGLSVVRVARSERSGRTTHLEMHHLVASLDKVEHLIDHHDLTLFEPAEYEEGLTGAGLVFEVGPGPIPDRDRYIARKASVES